jgi:hypothetical protein
MLEMEMVAKKGGELPTTDLETLEKVLNMTVRNGFGFRKSSFGDRPRNPRLKDAHAGTKRHFDALTINRESGICPKMGHYETRLVMNLSRG